MLGRALLLTIAGLGIPALGCGGGTPKAPTILRPIDEPHAVAIIARTFREFQLDPVRNRMISFGSGDAQLRLDVAAKDKRFGIAYITSQDAAKLGDALPRRGDPDAIIVVHGSGDDSDAHAALLFAADYMQDDLAGESHTSTSIAAEQKLGLAVKDVLRRAQHESWQ